ncbi:MAG: tetratricopeptide repeat protein [Verrucomicrobiota bacterium JB024]|nr:tetratricopeptide repeat protein [Verrucomicrobiota bacterium JB024]
MNKTLILNAALIFSAGLAAIPAVHAQESAAAPQPYPLVEVYAPQFWSDPEFVKDFLGSYGVNPQVEPEVTDDEVKLFRKLVDLIQTDPQAAALRLSQEIDEDSSAALNFVLANLYFQEGDLANAAKYYEAAIAKYPDYRRAHKNLGLLMMQDQDLAGAAEHLSRAVELGDLDGRNYGLLGYCYLDKADYVAAESAYRTAILQEPSVNDWKLGLAQSLLGQEEYSEANALFLSLIEADPSNPDLWLYQVNTALGMDRPREAAVNIEVVRRMGAVKPASLKLLGDIYMSMRMPDKSVEVYEELLAQDEDGSYKDASMRVAKYLAQAGSYDQSAKMIETIENRYPELTEDEQIELLLLQAQIARGQGQDEDAHKAFADIVARDPLNGEALIELAGYEQDTGNTDKAMFLYDCAAKVDGYEFKALLCQARIKVGERKFDEAIPLLRAALQYKDDARVARFLERVERAAKNS